MTYREISNTEHARLMAAPYKTNGLLELKSALEAIADAGCSGDIEGSDLPLFGGPEPSTGTAGVWSWDEDDLLVGDSWSELRIVSRQEWGCR